MIIETRINDINQKLEEIVEEISVPRAKYEEAERHYNAVGSWLAANDSEISNLNPQIYAQGSFALGTAIKPIGEEEYDVDAVCLLEANTKIYTQKMLKDRVGNRLRAHGSYSDMLEEKRRCWTINYSDTSKFHLDILPAIPASSIQFNSLDFKNHIHKDNICITDNTSEDYNFISDNWQKSNPVGYANWFKSEMIQRSNKYRIFNECNESVERLPLFKQTTILQKVIQLLKRHRNIRFKNDEDKPISIIITTLATLAYNGEESLFEAIKNITSQMENIIENRNGIYWVPNPVNPEENFADKWAETPRKKELFYNWLAGLKTIINDLTSETYNFSEGLDNAYGMSISKTINKQNNNLTYEKSKYMSNPAIKLFDVPYRAKPSWPVINNEKVEITTTFQKAHSDKTINYYSNGEALPKNGSLHFYLKTNIKEPFQVKWQVINTGQEALNAQCLRGNFFESFMTDSKRHQESTSYRGKHMIQASIIKEGICIGQSEEFVVNIQ